MPNKRPPLRPSLVAKCLIYRALQRDFRYTCGICGGYIELEDSIQFDHVHELVDDGQDRYDNLRPVHSACHKQKSAQSVSFRAHITRLSNGGRKKKGPPIKSRPFSKQKRPFRPKPIINT